MFRKPEGTKFSFLSTTSSSSLSIYLIFYRATPNIQSLPHSHLSPPLYLPGIFHCSLLSVYIYISLPSQILSILVLGIFVFLLSLSLFHGPIDIYTYLYLLLDSQGRGGEWGGFNNIHHVKIMGFNVGVGRGGGV